jgi:type I restriction-modification system DNA methylase subunit
MSNKEKRLKAKSFLKFWEGKGYEKGQSQSFWLSLLGDVLGVKNAGQIINFEEQVKLDNTSFIDGHISETNVLIEQKSINKDLRKPIKQSDGSLLTPFQQAKRYSSELAYSDRPRWIVVSNFKEFFIYDMEKPLGEPEIILLKNLDKEYYRLEFLVSVENSNLKKEMEVSIKAGELVGVLYDLILKQYLDPTNEDNLKNLNKLCVRLVFCLYAEDAGLFGVRNMFHDYLKQFSTKNVRGALINLFKVLDTKIEERDPYMEESLAAFPYVNGGLFSDENVVIPQFTDEIVSTLLANASEDFDWSEISPTIFGAVFESTLNQETRREGGMHYTSIKNIHKVIDPLFLDGFKKDLEEIKSLKSVKVIEKRLLILQEQLASLNIFDPACGSGNFLTESYLSLRRMENEIILLYANGQQYMGFKEEFDKLIHVSIKQFYGIEINDFAVTVAKTALWIAESQMLKETEIIIDTELDFLPLKSYSNILEANALRVAWEDVISPSDTNYIIGNPPFVGSKFMSKNQKADMKVVFEGLKKFGSLDYVTAWYWKASKYIENTSIRVAFVSTNSITQGEQPAIFFEPFLRKGDGIKIDFAYQSFIWNSGANTEAKVHCVIIGFSACSVKTNKLLFSSSNQVKFVDNINAYLLNMKNIYVYPSNKPLSNVPEIKVGNQPIDGGYYLFTKEEKDDFIKKEPLSESYFHPYYGAYEFINNKPRYCLYLANCPPNILKQMPECLKRVKAVKDFRLSSSRPKTVELADTPTLFAHTNIPKGSYIVIPQVSSQRRFYIPMGYMDETVICSDKLRLMPKGSIYHFGILESNVHMAWMRTFCCRLKSDYSYTVKHVYNTFPWPNCTEEQKKEIEKTAQKIISIRNEFLNESEDSCSLADLYDPIAMPPSLFKAHQNNDKAVMKAYGFSSNKMDDLNLIKELIVPYDMSTK